MSSKRILVITMAASVSLCASLSMAADSAKPSKSKSNSEAASATEKASEAKAPRLTLTEPVKIKITYGEAVLPRGLKLPVLSRNGETVTVKYLQETPTIPVSATDLK